MQRADQYLLPSYLDETFLDKNLMESAEKYVDEKIASITNKVIQRGRGNTDDLFNERKDWTDYINNLPVILNELNRRKCVSLMENDFENSLPRIVEDIINHK